MSSFEEHLVVLADSDRAHAAAIAASLSQKGFKTIVASDGVQALELFEQINPGLVIADLKLPSFDILEFIKNTRTRKSSVPIIITSFSSDIDLAVKAIQQGAFDYLLKPFQPEILLKKVRQAFQTIHLAKENTVLNELVSLYDITSKLTSTHALDSLLDITFQYCMQIAKADQGTLQLVDRENRKLVTVRKQDSGRGDTDIRLATMAEWVFEHCKSLLVADGRTEPFTAKNIDTEGIHTSISAPLKISGEVIGVVNLLRVAGQDSFTITDMNVIDVLASQAGIAINNANLYSSINQKLDELMLISTYSEQLMGVVDKYDVIRCLYETVIQHFSLDIIGFLIVQRHTHEFLYWARGEVDDTFLRNTCKLVIENYNKVSETLINERRVSIRKFQVQTKIIPGEIKFPMSFNHVIPVCGDDFKFGAVYFGTSRELSNANEKKTLLSGLVSQTRIALTNSKLYSDMKENYIKTIKALAIAVDAKDTYTHGHSENVMSIAEAIAYEMNIDEKLVSIIRDAGLLHDIGKIGIPGYILNKPGPLTYEEFNGIMKTHSALGANIVKDVPFLRDLYKPILYHHEHYDGNGYPEGLKGEQIPIAARILHVADAFEAMTSNRPYRNSLGRSEAIKRLTEASGKQFDPAVIDAFIRFASRKGWIE